MADELRWTPRGVGAAPGNFSFLREDGPPPYPEDIAGHAAEQDLGPELLFLAWDLARLAGPLSPARFRALTLVALIALAALEEGSTRVPIHDHAYLETLLTDLGATDSDRSQVALLIAEAETEGHLAPAGAVLGGPPGSTGEAAERPLMVISGFLYVQRLWVLERRIARAIEQRIATAEGPLVDETSLQQAYADLTQFPVRGPDGPVVLAEEQVHAVLAAGRGALTLISGGPGTGKTSIVVSILRLLTRLDVAPASIVLAAPTGKAADRLARATQAALARIDPPGAADRALTAHPPRALTLHRLLGYTKVRDRFRHDDQNPLAESVVIVDEASMIDVFLMDQLLRAVRAGARLIILGDAEQLPSVEAGAVFRDLCRSNWISEAGRRVALRKSYRMDERDPSGRAIFAVAQSLRAGDAGGVLSRGRRLRAGEATQLGFGWSPAQDTAPPRLGEAGGVKVRATATSVRFREVELFSPRTPEEREAFFEHFECTKVRALPGDDGAARFEQLTQRVYPFEDHGFEPAETESLTQLFEHFERFRILCLTRVSARGTGAEAVNRRFHRRALERARWAQQADVRGVPSFYPGEPVLVTQNDYPRGLYNGDQGIVLRVSTEATPRHHFMAVFRREDGFVPYPLEALRGRLELAFATTVHKAQGSEYTDVVVVLPERNVRLLTREILYTAVTRARRSVVFVGAAERIKEAAERQIERHAALESLLGASSW